MSIYILMFIYPTQVALRLKSLFEGDLTNVAVLFGLVEVTWQCSTQALFSRWSGHLCNCI